MTNGTTRPATPLERQNYQQWLDYYEGPLTTAIIRYKVVSNVATRAQHILNTHNIARPPIITYEDQLAAIDAINKYNTLGRILLGINSNKYGIRFAKGDIDAMAPPDMPLEDWQGDKYPTLGAIPVMLLVIVAGGLLVAGLYSASQVIEAKAKQDTARYQAELKKLDAQMMKTAGPVRADWMKLRQYAQNEKTKTKKQDGILVSIFGEEATGKIGGALAILLGIFLLPYALKSFKKGK